jgi:hypothetical protein
MKVQVGMAPPPPSAPDTPPSRGAEPGREPVGHKVRKILIAAVAVSALSINACKRDDEMGER